MSITPTTCPGNFCALAAYHGHYYLAAKDNATQEMLAYACNYHGAAFQPIYSRSMDGSAGAGFPSLAVSATDDLWLGYVPSDGLSVRLVNLSTNASKDVARQGWKVETFPVVCGLNGYAITWNNGSGTYQTKTYRYDHSEVATLAIGSGQGLARVADDLLTVVTNDENRNAEAQWGVLNPVYAGAVFGGEGQTGGIPLVYQQAKKIILAEGSEAFMPRVAQLGTEWAAAATGQHNQTVTLYTGITAADFTGVTVPPVEPPPIGTITVNLRVGQTLIVRGVA